jgi:hypothetical protein
VLCCVNDLYGKENLYDWQDLRDKFSRHFSVHRIYCRSVNGPLKIVNTFYVQYTDGTPFYGIGTTAYQRTSVKQSIQEKILETLATIPFNKIRMCVSPKNYRFGNDTEPWMYPFKRENGQNDFPQSDYEFFQNFDNRVEQLMEMGIQNENLPFFVSHASLKADCFLP